MKLPEGMGTIQISKISTIEALGLLPLPAHSKWLRGDPRHTSFRYNKRLLVSQ